MIKSWEELGDYLAEIENRISYLENSQGAATIQSQNENPTHEEAAESWSSKQWDVVNQLRSMVLYLQEKVNRITDKKAVGKQYSIK